MKKIVTINEGGFDNLGDHAIYTGLKNVINDCGYDCDSYNFTRVSQIYNKQILTSKSIINCQTGAAVSKIKIKHLFAKFSMFRALRWIQKNIATIIRIASKKYDVAFIGGGQLILSNTMFPFAILCWVLCLRLFGTKVYVIGVGSGKLFSTLEKLCYKLSFKLCSKVFLRDNSSIQTVNSYLSYVTYFIPDVAYYLSIINPRNTIIRNRVFQVGVIDYDVYLMYANEMGSVQCSPDDYVEIWVKDILALHDKFDSIVFSSTTFEDIYWSKKVYERISTILSFKQVNFIGELESLDSYMNSLKNTDTVISGRMHSLILGQSLGCNVIPWEVSKKITSYKTEMLLGNALDYKSIIKNTVSSIISGN